MGSGKHLNNAKKKYGLENFVMTILCYLYNEEEMNLLERMVVTPEFCAREDTYNINVGGDGGWSYVNENHLAGNFRSVRRLIEEDANYRKRYIENLSMALQKFNDEHPGFWSGENNPMYHHVYTEETHEKMSSSKQGEKNNRAGSKWFYDPLTFESHSFLPNEEIPIGWVRGRKMKRKT